MVHLLLRIGVWVLVLGVGYLVFGPDLFDTSPDGNPLAGHSTLYLPPHKSPRYLEYEAISQQRALNPEELAEYQHLVQQREARFWQQDGVSVEEALSGVHSGRKKRLVEILQGRGMSSEEISVFLLVVERDSPALLADRE